MCKHSNPPDLYSSIVPYIPGSSAGDCNNVYYSSEKTQPLFVLNVIASVSGLIFLSLFTDSLSTITSLLFASLCDRVRGFLQGKVIDKVANFLEITLFDNKDLLNLIKLREKGLNSLK